MERVSRSGLLLADNLRRERLRRGLTQEEFAELLHTSQSRVSEWERGLRDRSLSQLDRLAERLGMTPAELLAEPDGCGCGCGGRRATVRAR